MSGQSAMDGQGMAIVAASLGLLGKPEPPKTAPVKVVTDLRIVLEGRAPTCHWQTMEERGKALDRWAQELQEFIRDHRSQDNVSLTVELVIETQCDQCHGTWETYTEDGKTYCACCGVETAR